MNLYYPHKPYYVTQKWGNPNPMYSAQFHDLNFKLHNGIDAVTYIGQTDYPVYCPVEGFHVAGVKFEPNGGGNELWLESNSHLQLGDKLCKARIFLCHAKYIFVKPGQMPALGELLMIADTTGFATGPHTHLGLYRIDDLGNKLDQNEATGSTDPSPYFTGQFAVDKATLGTLIRSNMAYYLYKLRGG